MLYQKALHQRFGLYDLQYQYSSDYDFMMKVRHDTRTPREYLDRAAVKYRLGGNSSGLGTAREELLIEDRILGLSLVNRLVFYNKMASRYLENRLWGRRPLQLKTPWPIEPGKN